MAYGLAVIMVLSIALRAWDIGHDSYWYDETVSLRLARTADPAELMKRLDQIEATRAPLYFLILQRWVSLFGPSEAAARSLSLVFGVGTVLLVFALGRTFGTRSALAAAYLTAICPALVDYSREAKMYALLVFLAAGAWLILFHLPRFNRAGTRNLWLAVYACILAAMGYTHPLGLFMNATLALTSLVLRRAWRLPLIAWILAHSAAAAAILPWLPRYLDHAPEWTPGRVGLKHLLGLPIAYTGGNSQVLIVSALLIAWGAIHVVRGKEGRHAIRLDQPVETLALACWFALPPVALWSLSQFWHPIFGPTRYMLYVAPAFLILLARGWAKSPWWLAIPLGVLYSALAAAELWTDSYRPGRVSDWRAFAASIANEPPYTHVYVDSNAILKVEVETARYYLDSLGVGVVSGEHERDYLRALVDQHAPGPKVIYRVFTPGSSLPEAVIRRQDDLATDSLRTLHYGVTKTLLLEALFATRLDQSAHEQAVRESQQYAEEQRKEEDRSRRELREIQRDLRTPPSPPPAALPPEPIQTPRAPGQAPAGSPRPSPGSGP